MYPFWLGPTAFVGPLYFKNIVKATFFVIRDVFGKDNASADNSGETVFSNQDITGLYRMGVIP
jgi:hypothetical protein